MEIQTPPDSVSLSSCDAENRSEWAKAPDFQQDSPTLSFYDAESRSMLAKEFLQLRELVKRFSFDAAKTEATESVFPLPPLACVSFSEKNSVTPWVIPPLLRPVNAFSSATVLQWVLAISF